LATIIDQMTEIYVVVSDFFNAHRKLDGWRSSPNNEPVFTDAEVITIALMQNCLGVDIFKKTYSLELAEAVDGGVALGDLGYRGPEIARLLAEESEMLWKYLYRAVDRQGQTVDFFLSEHRDIQSAKQFFSRAIERRGAPEKITVDAYATTHTAICELKQSAVLPASVVVRTSKYLKNLIEQDHRRVKQRVYVMLGFKRFGNAAVRISGIELAHKIRKGQFDTWAINQDVARVWEAVLAA
jgi:hypothetical protein